MTDIAPLGMTTLIDAAGVAPGVADSKTAEGLPLVTVTVRLPTLVSLRVTVALEAGLTASLLNVEFPGAARLTASVGGMAMGDDATEILSEVLSSKKLSLSPVSTTTYSLPTSVAGTVIVVDCGKPAEAARLSDTLTVCKSRRAFFSSHNRT